jgi:hypothetical protein
LAPLRFGFGLYQISQTFDLCKVETAVLKRATGEFPRLGKPEVIHVRKLAQYCIHDGHRPMEMKLDNLFSGKAVLLREKQNKSLIQSPPFPIP